MLSLSPEFTRPGIDLGCRYTCSTAEPVQLTLPLTLNLTDSLWPLLPEFVQPVGPTDCPTVEPGAVEHSSARAGTPLGQAFQRSPCQHQAACYGVAPRADLLAVGAPRGSVLAVRLELSQAVSNF